MSSAEKQCADPAGTLQPTGESIDGPNDNEASWCIEALDQGASRGRRGSCGTAPKTLAA
jgi:hypothetical protein